MKLGNLFYFHKNDRIVVGFLVVMTTAAAVAVCLLDNNGTTTGDTPNAPSDVGYNGREGVFGSYEADIGDALEERKAVEMFPFDPNTANSTTFLRLGLPRWMVRNIYKYRAAGGTFRRKEDFARVHGLTKKQYETLAPYIRISDDYRDAAEFYVSAPENYSTQSDRRQTDYVPRDTTIYPVKLKPGERISVNTADTAQLKKVPGIGSSYARAIVRARERLGGFASKDQIKDIDGLPVEALQYLSVDGNTRKLNLNKLSYSQLRQHPYINFYQARDIMDYRRLRGALKSLADLRLLKSFTPADIERLKPYVEF